MVFLKNKLRYLYFEYFNIFFFNGKDLILFYFIFFIEHSSDELQ